MAEFRGGMLNSVGLANPGLAAVRERDLPWLAANLRRAQVLVNVVGFTVEEYAAVVAGLDGAAGVAGFRSLLSRALALAKAEVVSLNPVRVREDGSLEGFDRASHLPGAGPGDDGGVAVVAHLLWLLVTFIGEPLTLRLVRDAWPDAPVDETDRTAGGQA